MQQKWFNYDLGLKSVYICFTIFPSFSRFSLILMNMHDHERPESKL